MNKLEKDINRMTLHISIIEQYNNFMQIDSKEDIDFLINKVNNILKIENTEELIEEFRYCANIINSIYNEIDAKFKLYILKSLKDS